MTQFHAYRLRSGELVLDLQADEVAIPSRVVAPLRPPMKAAPPFHWLEPVLEVGGAPFTLHVGEMAALRARDLAGEPLADLSHRRADIIRAIDLLFTGA